MHFKMELSRLIGEMMFIAIALEGWFMAGRPFLTRDGLGLRVHAVQLGVKVRRDVAIKVLLPELSQINDEVERFALEARITGQLEHPYVVPVYEFGKDDERGRFLAMRLIQGKTLEETVEQAGITRLETDHLAD